MGFVGVFFDLFLPNEFGNGAGVGEDSISNVNVTRAANSRQGRHAQAKARDQRTGHGPPARRGWPIRSGC
eukprot:scaffold10273_cov122-Isochrysis_galbana.AAC.11